MLKVQLLLKLVQLLLRQFIDNIRILAQLSLQFVQLIGHLGLVLGVPPDEVGQLVDGLPVVLVEDIFSF